MLQNKFNILITLTFLLCSCLVYAQKEKIVGLWEIEKVEVGKENMTPVAKWMRINQDGSCQSGNGWLQNTEGTWTYHAEKKMYTADNPLGILDEFGGFLVSFDGEKMFFEREEEGMPVKVFLKPIEELPMSPADYFEGMWKLVDITDQGTSIRDSFDKEHKHQILIRWDRIYRNYTPEGKRMTGYWHINGHRPEITFLPHQKESEAESWMIQVDEKELIMKGTSDHNKTIERRYQRSNSF